MINVEGSLSIVGGTTPELVVLGAIRKQAGTHDGASQEAVLFLPGGWTIGWKINFLPTFLWVMVFHYSKRNPD